MQKGAHGPLARKGGVYLYKLYAGRPPPKYLVMPLLTGPVCLISQGCSGESVSPGNYI